MLVCKRSSHSLFAAALLLGVSPAIAQNFDGNGINNAQVKPPKSGPTDAIDRLGGAVQNATDRVGRAVQNVDNRIGNLGNRIGLGANNPAITSGQGFAGQPIYDNQGRQLFNAQGAPLYTVPGGTVYDGQGQAIQMGNRIVAGPNGNSPIASGASAVGQTSSNAVNGLRPMTDAQGRQMTDSSGLPMFYANATPTPTANGTPGNANANNNTGTNPGTSRAVASNNASNNNATSNVASDNRDQNSPNQAWQNGTSSNEASSTSQNQSSVSGRPLDRVLLDKLQKANRSEAELASWAAGKAESQEVKDLANQIAEDHRALNQQLEKIQLQNDASDSQSVRVPEQLISMGQAACDKFEQMHREMLSKQSGQDFEMAFLGSEILCHMQTIAELETIQQQGPQALRDYAGQAIDKQRGHLDRARQLAQQLEDDERNQAARDRNREQESGQNQDG